MVIFSNLLHLVSKPEAQILIRQCAYILAPMGKLIIYGPFLRGAEYASENDRAFDQALRNNDPEIGHKSVLDTQELMKSVGLTLLDPIEMPANNLILAATL